MNVPESVEHWMAPSCLPSSVSHEPRLRTRLHQFQYLWWAAHDISVTTSYTHSFFLYKSPFPLGTVVIAAPFNGTWLEARPSGTRINRLLNVVVHAVVFQRPSSGCLSDWGRGSVAHGRCRLKLPVPTLRYPSLLQAGLESCQSSSDQFVALN
jgi:hypothetical protein